MRYYSCWAICLLYLFYLSRDLLSLFCPKELTCCYPLSDFLRSEDSRRYRTIADYNIAVLS